MDWDETKRRSNLAKHGLDFRDFERFDWDRIVDFPSDVIDGEERLRVAGPMIDRLVFATYVERAGTMRLISLRPLTRHEYREWIEQHGG